MSPRTARSSRTRIAGAVFDVAVLVAYPLVVFVALPRLGPRWTALLLLALVGRRLLAAILADRQASRLVLVQAALVFGVVGLAAALGSPLALRFAPFVVSLTFIALFALSLRGLPIVERFARLERPDLPDDHVRYCRRLTGIWVALLAGNSLLILAASVQPDDRLWALLVGPVSYGYLGAAFTVEYVYRKWRFQEFSARPHDRLLRLLVGRREVAR